MGLVVALFLLVTFAIYAGFFFLISKALDIGTPLDSLRAALHRTWLGGVGVLSQLGAEAPFRAIIEENLPGFAD